MKRSRDMGGSSKVDFGDDDDFPIDDFPPGKDMGVSFNERTVSFQDGVTPTADYKLTRDTYVWENMPDQNFGTAATFDFDGERPDGTTNDVHALLRFDVNAVPRGSTVTKATLTVWVKDGTGIGSASNAAIYQLYPLKRDWREGSATWNDAATGSPWQVGGAKGSQDKGVALKAQFGTVEVGFFTIQLDRDMVQEWIDDPNSNFGIMFSGDANQDGGYCASREDADPTHHPKLTIAYLPPNN
jgi:hypothetical protein